MRLTDAIARWVRDAEETGGDQPCAVVVTAELFAGLLAEQDTPTPTVAGLAVLPAATELPAGSDLPPLEDMVEIPGPDRVSIYVGVDPAASRYPIGLDPAMPVVFVPVHLDGVTGEAQLETYNNLRWYGLGPDEAMAGSRG